MTATKAKTTTAPRRKEAATKPKRRRRYDMLPKGEADPRKTGAEFLRVADREVAKLAKQGIELPSLEEMLAELGDEVRPCAT